MDQSLSHELVPTQDTSEEELIREIQALNLLYIMVSGPSSKYHFQIYADEIRSGSFSIRVDRHYPSRQVRGVTVQVEESTEQYRFLPPDTQKKIMEVIRRGVRLPMEAALKEIEHRQWVARISQDRRVRRFDDALQQILDQTNEF